MPSWIDLNLDKVPFLTYLAAAGLFGLSLYQLSRGDFEGAGQTFMLALVAAGLKKDVVKSTDPVAFEAAKVKSP